MWANVSKMWVKAPSKWTEAKCKDKSNFEITFGKQRWNRRGPVISTQFNSLYFSWFGGALAPMEMADCTPHAPST